MTFQPWNRKEAEALATPFVLERGGLMPALHALQGAFGHISEEGRALLADLFNLSKAEVLGVQHFYDDFRDAPPERTELRICQGEACQAVGAEALFEALAHENEIELGTVFCLGNCAAGPSAMVGDKICGRASAEGLLALAKSLGEGS